MKAGIKYLNNNEESQLKNQSHKNWLNVSHYELLKKKLIKKKWKLQILIITYLEVRDREFVVGTNTFGGIIEGVPCLLARFVTRGAD